MGNKGCWTCRDRKLRCDLALPTCLNCVKARRYCQGYGIQLSWPRDGDKRRAIATHTRRRLAIPVRHYGAKFLNTSSWDVSLSYTLEQRHNTASYSHTLQIPRPRLLSPYPLGANNALLLDFCNLLIMWWSTMPTGADMQNLVNESRFHVLAPIVDEALPQFILRVALSDSSSPSNLVLESIFAISSLQLQGHSKSLLHQSRVISLLRESIMQLDLRSLLQNLIATMILYQYELSYPTKTTQNWSQYLCGAKRIIQAASASQELHQADTVVLMAWIYYHEVLTQFSLRHWNTSRALPSLCQDEPLAKSSRALVANIKCPFNAVDLLSDICRHPVTRDDITGRYTHFEMESIRELEKGLRDSVGEHKLFEKSLQVSMDRREMMADLHRISALIYFDRAIRRVSDVDFQHKQLARDGIRILKKLGSCETTWPLFILACEAHDDEQRLAILEVFSKTRQGQQQRAIHFSLIQQMVVSIWNQYDLHIDGDVDYLTIMNAVVSAAPFLPSFA